MPAINTHLKVAESISKSLNIKSKEFYLGNLLPDLTDSKNHKKYHFSENRIPNINAYLNSINDSNLTFVELGYLCHLLTDKFYNEFIFQKYIELINNNLISIKINGIREFYDEKKINNIKHSVYENYDKYLLQNNLINPIKKFAFLDEYPMPRVKEIKFDVNQLKKFLKSLNNDTFNQKNINYNIDYAFSNQIELDNLFSECCLYIIKFLKENNINLK